MKFPRQVVRHHRTESKHLIALQPPAWNDIQTGMLFGFGEQALLRPPAVMKEQNGFGRLPFVGDDDFVLVVKIKRGK
ncbi:hypothetical protein GWN42_29135 [candidate division KSB1 bacterium]|nr:hypothetical protein [candidate division KSB1 bacterium]NIV96742.1 hypothetical protein [candidate division KSB1 bacterium]NIW21445.1 hypothetical protein [candidate division KSB1 bacterium]NIW71907.1 hypothetical protein [candidate division KSB1 bacterium]